MPLLRKLEPVILIIFASLLAVDATMASLDINPGDGSAVVMQDILWSTLLD